MGVQDWGSVGRSLQFSLVVTRLGETMSCLLPVASGCWPTSDRNAAEIQVVPHAVETQIPGCDLYKPASSAFGSCYRDVRCPVFPRRILAAPPRRTLMSPRLLQIPSRSLVLRSCPTPHAIHVLPLLGVGIAACAAPSRGGSWRRWPCRLSAPS